MSESIKIYKPGTKGYNRLAYAAAEIARKSGFQCRVMDTMFDAGQHWEWTTVIVTRPDGGEYQALSPKLHDDIINGSSMDLDAAIDKAADEIRRNKPTHYGSKYQITQDLAKVIEKIYGLHNWKLLYGSIDTFDNFQELSGPEELKGRNEAICLKNDAGLTYTVIVRGDPVNVLLRLSELIQASMK